MNYYLYILYSPNFKRTYTGQTDELSERMDLHNAGKVKSTKQFRPWLLIHSESYPSRAEAMKREKWFKSKAGRKKIAQLLKLFLDADGNSLDSSRLPTKSRFVKDG
jgi:putative endonuclease